MDRRLPYHAKETLEAHIHSVCYMQMRFTPRSTDTLREAVLQAIHNLTIWAWQCDDLFQDVTVDARFTANAVELKFTASRPEVAAFLNSLEQPRTVPRISDDALTD